MTKGIVLCADDYGQAPAISRSIITLIKNQRLSATSCLVNQPDWLPQAGWLSSYRAQIDIGLHFNLTEGAPLSKEFRSYYGECFFSLPKLLLRVAVRKIEKRIIQAECLAQIDCFVKTCGYLPRFIDGHHHVHQLPIIREAVIAAYYDYELNKHQTYIRLVNEPLILSDFLQQPKKVVIVSTGTRGLEVLLNKHYIPHNRTFAGIYPFSRASQYANIFPYFLQKIADKGLIMCHPGLNATDLIHQARQNEYQYLNSDQFLIDCQNRSVILLPFF